MQKLHFPDMDKRNVVLLGEAGCGKSELAINLSLALHRQGREVLLFDLDMTKPLFRSRDEAAQLEAMGIHFHFEAQFADAPTMVGGVAHALKDSETYTVLDVGGDYIGARAIGGYAPWLNRDDTVVYYIVNPFRPWSQTAENAAGVLSQVLDVSHIRPEQIRFIGNPNLGDDTSLETVLEGYGALQKMVERSALAAVMVREDLAVRAATELDVPVFPIQRYLAYPWQK